MQYFIYNHLTYIKQRTSNTKRYSTLLDRRSILTGIAIIKK